MVKTAICSMLLRDAVNNKHYPIYKINRYLINPIEYRIMQSQVPPLITRYHDKNDKHTSSIFFLTCVNQNRFYTAVTHSSIGFHFFLNSCIILDISMGVSSGVCCFHTFLFSFITFSIISTWCCFSFLWLKSSSAYKCSS